MCCNLLRNGRTEPKISSNDGDGHSLYPFRFEDRKAFYLGEVASVVFGLIGTYHSLGRSMSEPGTIMPLLRVRSVESDLISDCFDPVKPAIRVLAVSK